MAIFAALPMACSAASGRSPSDQLSPTHVVDFYSKDSSAVRMTCPPLTN